ncbi:MAG: Holliday junction resolvase RuvX [Chloroflexi bacterium]|nr:Holliday junction resolvase RuvX [Chloroflexota bacterium]
MRTLALDVGDKRIGVAISDPMGILASPLTAIERTSDSRAIDAILEIADEQEAGEIVVGLPVSLSGGYSEQTKSVAAFVLKLEARSPVPVKTADERYSTVEAERLLSQSNPKRVRSRGEIDAAAAAVILQSYLDAQGSG